MLELLGMGGRLTQAGEEGTRAQLLHLLAALSHSNKSLFTDLLKTHKSVLKGILSLDPVQAAAFQHSAHLSLYQRRQLTRMFIQFWGFTPLPSEKALKEFEAEVSSSFTTGQLEYGQLLLHKSGSKDDTAKPTYYARVKSLPKYLSAEVQKALADHLEDPDTPKNLRHKNYGGYLRIIIGGDKGGDSTKITAVLGGGREPLVLGMFAATDSSENLSIFFADWKVQLRKMVREGLEVRDPDTKANVTMPVELLVNGDMAFVGELMGHSGSSARQSSLYRHVLRSHLQQGHRYTGTLHTHQGHGPGFISQTYGF